MVWMSHYVDKNIYHKLKKEIDNPMRVELTQSLHEDMKPLSVW